MHCSNEYPVFAPPDSLAAKDRWEWSYAEAKLYFDWLLDQSDSRIGAMLVRFDLTLGDDPRLLLPAGQEAFDLLTQPSFSEIEGSERKLTDTAYALCADMGLLVALFLQKAERIYWQVDRSHKRSFYYNMPVLTGFDHGLYMDPIHISINQGWGVLRSRKSSRAWYEVYEVWDDKIPE